MNDAEEKRINSLMLIIENGSKDAKNLAAAELIPKILQHRWSYGMGQILKSTDIDVAKRQKAMDDYLSAGRLHIGMEADCNLHLEVLFTPLDAMRERMARWFGGQPEKYGLVLKPEIVAKYQEHVKKTIVSYVPEYKDIITRTFAEAARYIVSMKSNGYVVSKDLELWAMNICTMNLYHYHRIAETGEKPSIISGLLNLAKGKNLLEEGRIIAADAALELIGDDKTYLVAIPGDAAYPAKTRNEVKGILVKWQRECLNAAPDKIDYNYTGHWAFQGFSWGGYRRILSFIAKHAQAEDIRTTAVSKLAASFNMATDSYANSGEYAHVMEMAWCKEPGCNDTYRSYATGKIPEAVQNAINIAVTAENYEQLKSIEGDSRLDKFPQLQLAAKQAREAAVESLQTSLLADKRQTVVALGANVKAATQPQIHGTKIPGKQ